MAEKLIGRLCSLAVGSWNVKSEIEKLENTWLAIKPVLVHAEELQDTNHQVKVWLERLKDAFDDADILLDDFSTERQQVMTRDNKKAKKVRKFFSSSNPLLFSFKMAQRIKEIREKLEAIDDDRKKFHFTNHRTLVGREEEKKVLAEFGGLLLFNMAEKLIGRLGSLAVESWNVKSDIEKLKNTMLTIQAVLVDTEEQQDTNYQVKHWLERLKDAFDDADILLDDFSTEALRQQVMTRDNKKAKKAWDMEDLLKILRAFRVGLTS